MHSLEPVERPPLERIVAFYNPASQHAAAAVNYIDAIADDLRPDGVAVLRLATELDSVANVANIERNLQEHDAVAIVGGDGAANCVLTGLAELRRANPAAILLGGNANDLAHMLHRTPALKNPGQIFSEGRIAPLTPIEITAATPSDIDRVYGFANWGIGSSALSGKYFAAADRRIRMGQLEARPLGWLHRLAGEYAVSREALLETNGLAVSGDLAMDDLIDITVSNGPRMAKIIPFNGVQLLEARAGAVATRKYELPERSLMHFLGHSILGRLQTVDCEHSLDFQVTSRSGELTAQRDGEAYTVSSGTQFHIGLADRGVNVYTTR